jgi:outer membrane receptor protein involved in Fe transport
MTFHSKGAKRRRPSLCAGLSLGAVTIAALTPASVEAQILSRPQPAHVLSIAAGPLDAALLALAAQTHEQLLFAPDLVAGLRAPAVSGSFTTEQALARLLGANEITVTRAGPSVLVLRRRPPLPVGAGGSLHRLPIADHGPVQAGALDRPMASSAGAAGQIPSVDADAPVTLHAIEVTGSHIRGASPASPLLVMDHAALERTGQTTVADALRTLPQNFGGVAGEGNSLTGADGVGRNSAFGSALNLRGLGNSATLVLIDGQRTAGSGTFGDFVDTSTIPMSAVERVEVLLDGASAVYGSDAVAGVVNVILRKDYEGAETRVLGGGSTGGGAGEFQASQLIGHRWDGGGMVFSYEHRQRGRLSDDSRDFSQSADLRPLGGSDWRLTSAFPGNILVSGSGGVLAPGYAIPAGQNGVGLKPSDLQAGVVNKLNQRQGEDLLPRQTQDSVYLSGHHALGDRLEVSADARYSFRLFEASQSPATTTLTVGRANPYYVAPSGAASESIAYSFVDQVPNPVQSGSVQSLGFTLDAKLRLGGDWRSEASATLAREDDRVRLTGFPNSLFLNEALGNTADNPATAYNAARDGYFNPFTGVVGANSAAVLGFINSGGTFGKSRDQVSTFNLQADGTVLRLPSGPLKLALGAQLRREELFRNGYNLLSTVTPAPFSTITDVSRRVSAVFAEAHIPLVGPDNARPGIQGLEISAAGRLEHYQSFGSTANPNVGVVWAPTQDLKLRATFSRSFRAPALRELYDPSFINPVLLTLGTARVRTLELTGGNPDLKPETADSWTGGLDFTPERWPGLKLSLTAFDVRFKNRIDRPASVNIANALSDPTLTSFVQHISPATNPADLALISTLLSSAPYAANPGVFLPTEYGAVVDVRYVNTAALHVRGVDFTGSYAFDVGAGQATLGANASYLLTYDQQLTPTAPSVDRLNIANYPLRFRSRLTADWTRGPVTLGAALNYVGAYHDSLGEPIGAQHTIDLQAELAAAEHAPMRGVDVLLNIRNLFDSGPPFYNNSQGFAYDPANADPIGRYISLQITKRW